MKVIYAPLSRQMQCLTEAICHFISPPCCTICNAPLHEHSEILCAGCLIEFVLATQVPYCPTCGTNCGLYELLDDHCHFCYHKKNIITRTVRVSSYQGPIKKIIGQLKFNGQTRFDKYSQRTIEIKASENPATCHKLYRCFYLSKPCDASCSFIAISCIKVSQSANPKLSCQYNTSNKCNEYAVKSYHKGY